MSPLQAMERSYRALKGQLRDGVHLPGHRLEANRLADDLGVSMTPVRDALNRLAGERLVEASSGEGFHVPRLSEGELRDLYEWHSALIIMAVTTATKFPDDDQVREALDAGARADVTSALFSLLAEAAPNAELRVAIHGAGDRLHPYRRSEASVLGHMLGVLEDAIAPGPGQRAAIRRYHTIRMRAVPQLVKARSVPI